MKLDFSLTAPRLVLRPYKPVDLQEHFAAVKESAEQLSPWLEWCYPDFTLHDANEWITFSRLSWQTDISYEFALFSRHDDTFIGSVTLSALLPMCNSANLGYWIRSSCHQQGLAREATIAVANFAFQELALTRLEIVTHTGNIASQRTALACHAKFECEARNRIFAHGQASNGLVYSLIPEDLMKR
ncbi:GNAT family N-acetyltransferase [Photobacterium sp.]|uniref:GNAT family N-acetyltransferase n=1 Tax=Photobacterium sp. TaxID=660 RepID=UPI00299F40AB|nr:GNAT family N-acetyltransferase [Photobacterium sp.]MDX1301939.1 GNAT family N-acetyltransferase [Photobacterium sp.]